MRKSIRFLTKLFQGRPQKLARRDADRRFCDDVRCLRLEPLEDRNLLSCTVNLECINALGLEGGGAGFKLSLTSASDLPAGIYWSTGGGTATGDVDYVSQEYGFHEFMSIGEEYIVSFIFYWDETNEPNETFQFEVRESPESSSPVLASETVTIIDLPRASISVLDTDAGEQGCNPGSFRISLDTAVPFATEVSFSVVGGTADPGCDYELPSNYSVTIDADQTYADVSITPIDDSDVEGSETVQLGIDQGSTYIVDSPSAASLTIMDNDALSTVSIAAQDGAASEPGSDTGTFRVTRSGGSQSTDLTVFYSIAGTATGGSDYQSLSGSVTIPAYQSYADIAITPYDDYVAEGSETVQLTVSPDAGYTIGSPSVATVTISDNDAVGVIVNPTSGLVTTEAGGTATFTVRLNSQPLYPVTISLNSSDTTEGTVSATSLTFTSSNWGTVQTVTVTGVNDAVVDGNVAYTIVTAATSSDPAYNAVAVADVSVTNTDNDALSTVSIAAQDGAASESGSDTGTFRVTRSNGAQPTDLTVFYSIAGTATGGSDYQSLSGSVAIPAYQSYADIAVAPYDDYVAEGSETVQLTVSPDAGYTIGSPSVATVTISDDDTAGVIVNPTSGLVTTEAGGTATFTVRLNSQPLYPVTISLNSSDTTEGTVSATSLSFTSSNWSTVQTATVTGVDDALVDGNVAYTIVTAATSSDPAYNAIAVADVSVTNTDNDALSTVSIAAQDGAASEPGSDTGTFRVTRSGGSLSTDLTVFYSIAGTATGGSDYQSLSGSVAIPAYQSYADIAVAPYDDSVAEGSETVQLTLTSDAGYTVGSPSVATVTISDNDTAGVIVNPTSGLVTTEAGGTATFTVRLNSQPLYPVTISLNSSDTTEGTVSATSLTFTSSNWGTVQTVTVTGVNDAVVDGNVAYTIVTAATSSDPAYNAVAVADVSVTNTDNDAQPSVSISILDDTANEQGLNAAAFRVTRSDGAQSSELSVSYQLDGTAINGSDYLGLLGSIRVLSGQAYADIVIVPCDDSITEGNETVQVTLTSGYGYTVGSPSIATITIIDNDTPAVIVSPTSGLTTTETGWTATFTVRLRTQPLYPVTISLNSSDTTEGTVSAPSLTFTSSNWSTVQTVTVTGVDDAVADGYVSYWIAGGASSSDPDYDDISVPYVSVTNVDNDQVGVVVNPTSGLVTTEAGGTATFTVRLNSQPLYPVTISLNSSDTTEGTVSAPSLTFASSDWSTVQTVTVTGVDDALVDGNVAYTIVTAATSSDPAYNAIAVADVSVTNTDNDTAGVIVNPTSGLVTTEAGGTATFTVRLNSQPLYPVTISLNSSDTTEGIVSPAAVVFGMYSWSTLQTVTITGLDDWVDDGDVDYTITTSCESTDIGYYAYSPADVSVTNRDDDTAGVSVTPTEGLVTTEVGRTDTFLIRLNCQPTYPVRITVQSSDTSEGTVGSANVTFGQYTWSTAQTVTVTGVDDSESDGDVEYWIETSATSDDSVFDAIAVDDVKVTNLDDERPVNSTRDLPDNDLSDGIPWTGLTNTAGEKEVTLRAAIEQFNAKAGRQNIDFKIPTSEEGYNSDTGVYTIATSGLPQITEPAAIRGNTQPGWTGSPIVEICGGSGSGLYLGQNAGGSTVQSLAIYSFAGAGITVRSGANNIQGNYVGMNALGSALRGNSGNGIEIINASGNTIGGFSGYATNRNVVSGNAGAGVLISGTSATNNRIEGNCIGTDINGTSAVGNQDGVVISNGASGNRIGTDDLAGGDGSWNVISGNAENGVRITDTAHDNMVFHNLIGTIAGGAAKLPNKKCGVLIDERATRNLIGRSWNEGNVISGNDLHGVHITSNANTIGGNLIGVGPEGETLGNGGDGVRIEGNKNLVGWTIDPVTCIGNWIANNGVSTSDDAYGNGVTVRSGTGNSIRFNSIHDNEGLGIDLDKDLGNNKYDYFTINQRLDADDGPNRLQDYPVIWSVDHAQGQHTFTWLLDSVPNSTYTIDFYSIDVPDKSGFGEGKNYLRSVTRTTGSDGKLWLPNESFDFPLVSATATDSKGNTSEFSMVDSDGDALADAWETPGPGQGGVDFDGDGTIELDLCNRPDPADPNRPDLFVEVDTFFDKVGSDPVLHINQSNLDRVMDAFALNGVRLHAYVDDPIPNQDWRTGVWAAFDRLKDKYFYAQHKDAGDLDAAQLVYRYAIVANTLGRTSYSGLSEIEGDRTDFGNDILITLGAPTWGGGTDAQKEGTFMHELGHSLGLWHGGGDTENYKPNYPSVMNYARQVPTYLNDPFVLDYSHGVLPSLNENSLNEQAGLGGNANQFVGVGGLNQTSRRQQPYREKEAGPIDFDRDGKIDNARVRANVNDWGANHLPRSTTYTTLSDYNDWAGIRYYTWESSYFARGQHPRKSAPGLGVSYSELLGLPSESCFVFGPPSPLIEYGLTEAGDTAYDTDLGYGWQSISQHDFVDAGIGDGLTGGSLRLHNGRFVADVPDGEYILSLVMGDYQSAYGQMELALQGQVVDVVTTAAGQFHQSAYHVTIDNGSLQLEVTGAGEGSGWAVINAMALTPVDSLASASIRGSVWQDNDADGLWDAGEAPLAGWTVYLDDGDGQQEPGEPVVTTDAYGSYLFTNLEEGNYSVAAGATDGWQRTSPLNGGNQLVSLDHGQLATTSFGMRFEGGMLPVVSVCTTTPTISEASDAPAEFTILRTGDMAQPLTVYFRLSGTASDSDYWFSQWDSVTIPAGASSTCVSLSAIDDCDVESSEIAALQIAHSGQYITDSTAFESGVCITDNDVVLPLVSVQASDAFAAELGAEPGQFTITRTGPTSEALEVYFEVVGTAVNGVDYLSIPWTVTIPAGQSSATISIEPIDDLTMEPSETVEFQLYATGQYDVQVGTETAIVQIGYSDGPTLRIDRSVTVREGSGAKAVFEVTLLEPSDQTVTVHYATVNETAAAGSDYTEKAGTLTFPPGVTTQSIEIDIRPDLISEPDQQFSVVLSDASNASIDEATGIAVIEDSNPLPTVSITNSSSAEGDTSGNTLTFTLTLSSISEQPITVDFTTLDGTAQAWLDYLENSGSVTFEPGETLKTITIDVISDIYDEPDGQFFVVLAHPVNVTLDNATGIGTIVDDDCAPSIDIDDSSTVEGEVATFTITLSAPSGKAIEVDFATSDGTATAGNDYEVTTLRIIFDPWQTSRTISIDSLEDYLYESPEDFQVILSNPLNATIGDGIGTGAIQNLNHAPVLDGSGDMTLNTIDEDDLVNGGSLVSQIVASAGGDRITDLDVGGVEGIAVTAVDNTNGVWEYRIGEQGAWTAFGTPSEVSARLLAADLSTWVRFVPGANWNGTVGQGITFRAWDRTSGAVESEVDTSENGGATAFSLTTATASITVASVNDAPVIGAIYSTPAPVASGHNMTLTATGVTDADGSVIGVSFYRESNGATGLQTGSGGDTFVGPGSTGATSGDWSLTFSTTGVAVGDHTYYAQATDNAGDTGVHSIATHLSPSLDIDGNGSADALTDGILILRYLFDPAGQWNYSDALGSGATRTTRPVIKSYIDAGTATTLDVDGNGAADALTDGILILRYLFDPAGQWNYSDTLGSGATRTTRTALRAYLDQFNPNLAPSPEQGVSFMMGLEGEPPSSRTEMVSASTDAMSVEPGAEVLFDVNFTTSDQNPYTMGLGLYLYYDSTKLSVYQPSNLTAGVVSTQSFSDDIEDSDNDPTTDQRMFIGWASLSRMWPGEFQFDPESLTLLARLYTARFYATATATGSTSINFTSSSSDAAYEFASTSLTITFNHAPVLDNSGSMSLPTIDEDPEVISGMLVSELIASAGGDRITDLDAAAVEGIAVTAVDNTYGMWQYKIGAQGAWTDFGAPSKASARLLAADLSTWVRFVPGVNWNGTVGEGITFRAWDQIRGTAGDSANTTVNGAGTAFSTVTAAASITVSSVNDAPLLNNSGTIPLMAINEDDADMTLAPAFVPGYATLLDDWIEGVSVTVPVLRGDTGEIVQASFAWHWCDLPSQNPVYLYRYGNDTYGFTLIPVEGQDPIPPDPITVPGGLGTAVSSIISREDPIGVTYDVRVGDVDAGSVQGIAVTGVDNVDGTWQFKIGDSPWTPFGTPSPTAARLLDPAALIRFVPNANYSGMVVAGVTFRAWDQTSGTVGGTADTTSNGGITAFSTAMETVSITVNPVNDAPVIASLVDSPDPVALGQTIILIASGVTDADVPTGVGLWVDFYRESNGTPGLQTGEGGDTPVGSDSDPAGGWSTETSTTGLALGDHTYYAQVADDQGALSEVVSASNTVVQPDLVGLAVDVRQEHVLAGLATLDFSIKNQGQADAGAFDVEFVLSDDAVIGNADDVVLARITISPLVAGATVEGTVNLSLPVPVLYAWALRDDALGMGTGYLSTSSDHIGMVIDPTGAVAESDETNNFNQGLAADKDDVTYFPWDVDGDGVVASADAESVSIWLYQAVPPADRWADLDGDGQITSVDRQAILDRLGYCRNDAVISNVAPVLDNTGSMSLPTMDEDPTSNSGVLVADLIASAGGSRITDLDSWAVAGIAVTTVVNTGGTWEYSLDGGTIWSAFGTPSNQNARLLAANADTRIRFVPDANWNGTLVDGISFRAWDQTLLYNGATANTASAGGKSAFSTAVGTASITVNAVNDLPSIGTLDDAGAVYFEINQVLALTVSDVTDADGSVVLVGFYRESNGVPGLQIGEDTPVGYDDDPADGWALSVGTSGLSPGNCTYYALATDDQGGVSADMTAAVSAAHWLVYDLQAPLTEAGGPYTIHEGQTSVILNGSGTTTLAGTITTYEWDLDGDGVYGEEGRYWVEGTWYPGWDETVYVEGHYGDVWVAGHYGDVWHDAWTETVLVPGHFESVWVEGHTGDVWHDAWTETVVVPGHNESVWVPGHSEDVWHPAWTETILVPGHTGPVWVPGHTGDVWHDPWTETVFVPGHYGDVWIDGHSETIQHDAGWDNADPPQWHDEPWTETIWVEGHNEYQWIPDHDETIQHPGYWEYSVWIEGHYEDQWIPDHNETIEHEGYWEYNVWIEGHNEDQWVPEHNETIEHPGYWEYGVWIGGQYENQWVQDQYQTIEHPGYWEQNAWIEGHSEWGWIDSHYETVNHPGYWDPAPHWEGGGERGDERGATVTFDVSGLGVGTVCTVSLRVTNDLGHSATDSATVAVIAANNVPSIATLADSPEPIAIGQTLTLSATDVSDSDGQVTSVSFYRETNGIAGLQTGAGGDTAVGWDNDSTGGWSVDLSTTGLTAGDYTYYAQATDDDGGLSAAVSAVSTLGDPLRLAVLAGQVPGAPLPALTDDVLRSFIQLAMALWETTGLSDAEIAALQQLTFRVADLPDNLLGMAVPGAIIIDVDAAGFGWFTDTDLQPTGNRVDLLTVVLHELGHELGFDDILDPTSTGLMSSTLPLDTRRLPDQTLAASAADQVFADGLLDDGVE